MKRDALKDLCLRYLDGDLAGQEAESFSQLIAGSENAARLLARMAIHDSRFETTTALVLPVEEEQGKLDRMIDEALRVKQVQPQAMGGKEVAELLGFVLVKAVKTRQAKWLYSAAATVLLAFVVWQVWAPASSPQDQASPPSLAQDDQADPVSPASPTVATLTAGYNATWATPGGTLAPTEGDSLHSGQRLTLIDGFAEVTTRRGAIAILESPCVIELIENDNAIYLHSGKLVGICETESSKGFRVNTMQMDIIDLGTRFGVDASTKGRTTVTVFEGEVQAASTLASPGTPATRLTQGQAASAAAGSTQITVAAYEPQRFATVPEGYQSPDYVLAYWRFEEGTPGSKVPHVSGRQEDFSSVAAADFSGQRNLLYSYNPGSSPSFTDKVPTSIIPQTGQFNRVAIDDSAVPANNVINLFTNATASSANRPVESVELNQWTIEASVKPASLDGEQAFVSSYNRNAGDEQGLLLGLRDGRLFVSVDDDSGQLREVVSPQTIGTDRWVHVAATCDGQTLSLYAKSAGDATYRLLGQTSVDRAITSRATDLDAVPHSEWGFAIGSARLTKDARALIDEVRISDKALAIDELLFSEPNP